MSDEEQIRLLTEIRDILKSQAAWTRQTIKQRGRIGIVLLIIFLAVAIGGYIFAMQAAKNDAQRLIDENRKAREPISLRETPEI